LSHHLEPNIISSGNVGSRRPKYCTTARRLNSSEGISEVTLTGCTLIRFSQIWHATQTECQRMCDYLKRYMHFNGVLTIDTHYFCCTWTSCLLPNFVNFWNWSSFLAYPCSLSSCSLNFKLFFFNFIS